MALFLEFSLKLRNIHQFRGGGEADALEVGPVCGSPVGQAPSNAQGAVSDLPGWVAAHSELPGRLCSRRRRPGSTPASGLGKSVTVADVFDPDVWTCTGKISGRVDVSARYPDVSPKVEKSRKPGLRPQVASSPH